jgi:hypothetical protein
MRPGVLGRPAGRPTLIAKSVTPKEAGGRKAVSRSRGPFGRGRGQHSCAGTCPKGSSFEIQTAGPRMRGVERGRSGCARAELWAIAKRQEDECTGESMLPSNTDDGDCVGPYGPSRRSGRSRCMSSSIGRPVQNCAAYPQLAKQNTECSAVYPQLAKQTLALCVSGFQPEMRPSVAGARA